jgi:hypothetical protein
MPPWGGSNWMTMMCSQFYYRKWIVENIPSCGTFPTAVHLQELLGSVKLPGGGWSAGALLGVSQWEVHDSPSQPFPRANTKEVLDGYMQNLQDIWVSTNPWRKSNSATTGYMQGITQRGGTNNVKQAQQAVAPEPAARAWCIIMSVHHLTKLPLT